MLSAFVVVATDTDPVLGMLGVLILILPFTGAQPRGSIIRPELTGGAHGWRGPWTIRCSGPARFLAPLLTVLAATTTVSVINIFRADNSQDALLGWIALILLSTPLLLIWGYSAIGVWVLDINADKVMTIRKGILAPARVRLDEINTVEVEHLLWRRIRVTAQSTGGLGKIHLRTLSLDLSLRRIILSAPFLHGVDLKELSALLIDRSNEARSAS